MDSAWILLFYLERMLEVVKHIGGESFFPVWSNIKAFKFMIMYDLKKNAKKYTFYNVITEHNLNITALFKVICIEQTYLNLYYK